MAYEPLEHGDVLNLERFASKVSNNVEYVKAIAEEAARRHDEADIPGLVSLVTDLASRVEVLSQRLDGVQMQFGSKGSW